MSLLYPIHIDGHQLLRCILNRVIEREKSANGNRQDCVRVVLRELMTLQEANALSINKTAIAIKIADFSVGEHFDKQFDDKNQRTK